MSPISSFCIFISHFICHLWLFGHTWRCSQICKQSHLVCDAIFKFKSSIYFLSHTHFLQQDMNISLFANWFQIHGVNRWMLYSPLFFIGHQSSWWSLLLVIKSAENINSWSTNSKKVIVRQGNMLWGKRNWYLCLLGQCPNLSQPVLCLCNIR